MARYHFVTDLVVPAPRDEAWAYLTDPKAWLGHWRWLRSIESLDGDRVISDPVGSRVHTSFHTALPYTISFVAEVTRAEPPWLLDTVATGDLAGSGRWELIEVEVGGGGGDGGGGRAGTLVRYTWIVETTKRWMNLLGPIARPAFAWNHDVLMRDFARGFADALGVSLTSVENRTVRPSSPEFGRTVTPD